MASAAVHSSRWKKERKAEESLSRRVTQSTHSPKGKIRLLRDSAQEGVLSFDESCFVNGSALIKREEFQSHLCFTTVGLCSESTESALEIKLKTIMHELTCFSAKLNYSH